MMVSHEIVQEILRKADIVDIVKDYVPLERKGKNYTCRCPFHDDHSPSLSVSPDKQIFKCFVCGEGGNAITFVQKYENISFMEAAKKVGEKVGIRLELDKPRNIVPESVKRIHQLNAVLADYANYCLHQDADALGYLHERSTNLSVADQFALGIVRDEGQLKRFLLAKGYSEEEIKKSDIYSEKGYFRWKDRLLFPLKDSSGNIVGFSGRLLNKADGQPKYINTPENEIYHKRKILYNLHSASAAAKRTKQLIVMEGYMDVVKAQQHDIQNCVATCGTALTEEQVGLIKKLDVSVVLCFDGDGPGLNAADKNYAILKKADIPVSLIKLPSGMDPDDLLNQNPEKFKQLLISRMNYLDFQLSNYVYSNDYSLQQKQILTFMKQLTKENDVLAEEFYLKKLSSISGYTYEALKNQYASLKPDVTENIQVQFSRNPKNEIKPKTGIVKINFASKPKLDYKAEITKNFDKKEEQVMAYDEEKVLDRKGILEKYLEHKGAVLETVITLVGFDHAAEKAHAVSKEVVDEIASTLEIKRDNLQSISYLHTDTKHPHIHLQIWQKEPYLDKYKLSNKLVEDLEKAVEKEMSRQVQEPSLKTAIKL